MLKVLNNETLEKVAGGDFGHYAKLFGSTLVKPITDVKNAIFYNKFIDKKVYELSSALRQKFTDKDAPQIREIQMDWFPRSEFAIKAAAEWTVAGVLATGAAAVGSALTIGIQQIDKKVKG